MLKLDVASNRYSWTFNAGLAFQTGVHIYAYFAFGEFFVKLFGGVYMRWRKLRILKDVPDMKIQRHWLWGGVKDIMKNRKRLHHWRDEATRDLPVSKMAGPIWDGDMVVVAVRDPACIRYFLKENFNNFTKTEAQTDWGWFHLCRFLGKGIFIAKHGEGAEDGGALWTQQRKIAAAIFTRSNFNNGMHRTFVEKAKKFRNMLKSGEVVDMQKHMFNFTMDSIMRIFFGEESDTLCGSHNTYGNAFDMANRLLLMYVINTMSFTMIVRLLPWPFGGYSGVLSRLRMLYSDVNRSLEKNIKQLDKESEQIIGKCADDPALAERSDLLALFMQALESENLPRKESTRYLRDTVLNFALAGRDTTACTLSWMFYILGTHPELQQRVSAEIDERLPDGTEPNLKLLHHSNMPLLHALVYETLRLYPPVPLDIKESQSDSVFPGGWRIPKKSKVWFMPYAMGRDPGVYPEPEKVNLERWIPFKQPNPYEFPVFQAGPRMCLGMDMAIFEAKILASILLQEFTFKLLEGEADKIHYSHMITMSVCNSKLQDSHNLWLIPERRS